VYKDRQVTVVIPWIRKEAEIRDLLSRIPSFVDEVILVLDEASREPTPDLSGFSRTRAVRVDARGYGRSYRNALMHARGDIIVALDADHLYPVDAVSYLIEILLRSKARFISGSRFPLENKNAMSLTHRLGNSFLSLVFSLLYLRWVRDSQSGMWIFERSILAEVDLISDMRAFSEELKIEAIRNPHIGFLEVYVEFSSRSGEYKLRPWRDGVHNLLFMIRKCFTRRRTAETQRPQRRKIEKQT
jgi:dolichol-phosphate hexosyltransferase